MAELAGIGVDWYVRMEQGRTVSPSDVTFDALARALRLGAADSAHLRALARGGDGAAFSIEPVPPTIVRLVQSYAHPAYVTGRRWDLLAWNDAAADVLCFDRLADIDRNLLVFMFATPLARDLFGAAWHDEARRMIALFRATHDLWADDPAFIELVERLKSSSTDFADGWNRHDVRIGVSGEKVLHHPVRGALRYTYATFQSNDDAALKLAIYTPV
ncbi:putative DNA-binding protein [Candidatus Burkholderia verschuerenii]|uniref:Putative DNA-binding protein n=1 Tax=Candidatus Burkholderia verschuerenii TaxID=242163 RepID=A0A0L0MFE8_9BURK|nr:putative DNA-binding protein [Candidatus Burkholderia verschuerenii]